MPATMTVDALNFAYDVKEAHGNNDVWDISADLGGFLMAPGAKLQRVINTSNKISNTGSGNMTSTNARTASYSIAVPTGGSNGSRKRGSSDSEPASKPSVYLTADEVVREANRLLNFWYESDYKLVKRDTRWNRIYGRRSKSYTHIKHDGTAQEVIYDAYPCHFCGIIMPSHMVEVEHRQPKAKAGLAVLKCVRMLGKDYTKANGAGTKAGQFGAIEALASDADATAVAGLTQSFPEYNGRWTTATPDNLTALFVKSYTSQDTDRYTLTDKGRIFVSLLVAAWSQSDLGNTCLNNLLNLVPGCSICNKKKGDRPHARHPTHPSH